MGNVIAVDTYKIRFRMKEKQITDQKMAKLTGLSRSYVRQLIAGYTPEFWEPHFEKIAKILDLPMKEIVSELKRA